MEAKNPAAVGHEGGDGGWKWGIFSEITNPMDKTLCNSTRSYSNQSDFVVNVKGIIGNMSSRVVSNNGFWRDSVGSGNSTVYAIGQCWETLNMSSCKTCLDRAASKIDSCLPSFQARVLSSGCYLRYADYQFYNDSSTTSTSFGVEEFFVDSVAGACSQSDEEKT